MDPAPDDGSTVSFRTVDGTALEVRDEVEGPTLRIRTDAPIDPQRALTDLFHFPVDRAVSFTASELVLDESVFSVLRDGDGETVTDFPPETDEYGGRGVWFIETSAPVKTYTRVADTTFTAGHTGEDQTSPLRVSFGEPTRITLGARSLHSRPAAEITVPPDPEGMMRGVSYLGSSIKEFSAERSWPTLRGHPPALELGETLTVPDDLTRPDTGFVVRVPPTLANVYRVAPLAYYFGATVEPGDDPVLSFPNGHDEPLDHGGSLEAGVDSLVTRAFLLDTLVRSDGYIDSTVGLYDELGPKLPFYPENLYDEPVADALLEYLEVPDETIERAAPNWGTTAVLRPHAADVERLPTLLDSLARIHVAESPPAVEAVDAATPTGNAAVAYTHEAVPSGGTRLHPESAGNARDHERPSLDELRFAYVTDDGDDADRVRDRLDGRFARPAPDRVDVAVDPTRDDLRDALGDADAAYVDLPATAAGVACADGEYAFDDGPVAPFVVLPGAPLAAATAAVDGGGVVGLVTPERGAGREFLRLARPLRAGHVPAVAASFALPGSDYRFAGHPTHILGDMGGSIPILFEVISRATDEHGIVAHTVSDDLHTLGGVVRIYEAYADAEPALFGASVRQSLSVDTDTVVDLLADGEIVLLNGEPYHGEAEPTADLVRESAQRAVESAPESTTEYDFLRR